MALMKWDPFRDIDRFFEDFSSLPQAQNLGWDLAVDVYEEGNNVVAEMNLPGIDPQNVDVSVEDTYLRISGSREEKSEDEQTEYYTREIRRGSFERMVRLPQSVKAGEAEAEYKGGVLRVTIPKAQEEKSNSIDIKVKE